MVNWLAPLSCLYGVGVRCRRSWLQRQSPGRLPVPVISIGNITTGGTGKTEAVDYLCRLVTAQGYRPGILSRGYGRRSRESILVVSAGQGPRVLAEEAGDEPFLLAARWPQVPVVVGADRLASGRAAIRLGCDALILDDGFQRRDQVFRDLDVVLVDAGDPFGRGYLLPAGRLREPKSALAEADALIITRADQAPVDAVQVELHQIAPRAPVFLARHAPARVTALGGGPEHPVGFLHGRRVMAVSAIARPGAFRQTLESLGACVTRENIFPDHHWFGAREWQALADLARREESEIITTAKDAVRLTRLPGVAGWVLEIRFEMPASGEDFARLVYQALTLPAQPVTR